MDKPFLSIDDQISLLAHRGVEPTPSQPTALMRDGYYSIVNGYKDAFIDFEASAVADDDRFMVGTSFDDIYNLFKFDRSLRALTFQSIIKAEALVRTAVAYTFASAHREHDSYLLQESYCSREEYSRYNRGGSPYVDELSGLISILRRVRDKNDAEFVVHYRNEHGSVPIWVLCNALTFGNVQHFFNLMKPEEKQSACKMIVEATGRKGGRLLGYFDVQEARVSLEVLVKFRNLCAHDERLYCAHVGSRKNVGFDKMVWMLERYLPENEFYEYLLGLTELLEDYLKTSDQGEHVLNQLGFPAMIGKIANRVATLEKVGP